jgi:molybdopterin molybdotransferase
MQENVSVTGNSVAFTANTDFGQNIREIGEDIKQGERVLARAKKLTAIDIALLVSLGISSISVKRRIKIALFSTGDELVPLGEPLALGQIYDSNRYLLNGLLNDACYQLTDGGIIADDPVQLEQQLLAAADTHDAVISTGGASVGDADYVKTILQQRGTVHFWKLAIKPGKPFAFGQLNTSYFFGIAGNPVAVIATLQQLVKPALAQLSGAIATQPLQLRAICSSALKKSAGRQEFQRGILSQDAHGAFYVSSAGKQGSHLLVSMSRANCFINLPIECAGVAAGEWVMVEPFSTLL